METAKTKIDEVARVCAALGHSLRLETMAFLVNQPHGGAYVTDVVSHLSKAQSTVSHHLKILVNAGILVMESRGNWGWYQIVPTKLAELREYLEMFGAITPAMNTGVII